MASGVRGMALAVTGLFRVLSEKSATFSLRQVFRFLLPEAKARPPVAAQTPAEPAGNHDHRSSQEANASA